MGAGYFMMGWMWIIPVLFFVVLFGTLYFLLRGATHLQNAGHSALSSKTLQSRESALEILKKRYARGNISREEFEQMKHDLMDMEHPQAS